MAVKHAKLTCPYCANNFDHLFELEQFAADDHIEFVYCDNEETNGCGKRFVIVPTVEVNVKTFVLSERSQ